MDCFLAAGPQCGWENTLTSKVAARLTWTLWPPGPSVSHTNGPRDLHVEEWAMGIVAIDKSRVGNGCDWVQPLKPPAMVTMFDAVGDCQGDHVQSKKYRDKRGGGLWWGRSTKLRDCYPFWRNATLLRITSINITHSHAFSLQICLKRDARFFG